MKKLFLIGLMMLASSAWAEWVMYHKDESITFYFDPATIRKDGNIRRVWVLQDLSKRQDGGVMSRRIRHEYDCKQERFRHLGFSAHSEPMAGGELLVMGDEHKVWTDVPPSTAIEIILNIVCAK